MYQRKDMKVMREVGKSKLEECARYNGISSVRMLAITLKAVDAAGTEE